MVFSLQLEKPVRAEGNVEVWLNSLMTVAQSSLHGVIRTASLAIQDSAFKLLEFLDNYPAQVGTLYTAPAAVVILIMHEVTI
jgi:dynein heavy chain